MKKICSTLLSLIMVIGLFVPVVQAEGESSSVYVSGGDYISNGESMNFSVGVETSGFAATGAELNVTVDSGLEIVGVSGGQSTYSSNSAQIVWSDSEGAESFYAEVTVKAVSDFTGSSRSISVSGYASVSGGIVTSSTSDSSSVYMASGDCNLTALTVNGSSVPSFSPNTTSYTLADTNNSGITISATTSNSKAGVSGTGDVSLGYGNNTFSIVVTAENGNQKTYTVSIKRNDKRSTDNTLKSLSVDCGKIDFLSYNVSYSVKVAYKVNEATIKAEPNDSKAEVSGAGKKTLVVGINKFDIVVKAENESTKTYSLYIIREDESGTSAQLSVNNYLSELELNAMPANTKLDFDFKPEKQEYTIFVDNTVTSVAVNAKAADEEATLNIDAPATLNSGTNEIKVTSTAPSAAVRTYIIHVIKGDDNTKHTDMANLLSVLTTDASVEVTLDITEDDTVTQLSSNVMSALKTSGKKLYVHAYDKGQLKYIWELDGKNINNVVDFDTAIKFDSITDSDYTKALKKSEGIQLDFAYSGELPLGTVLKVYVGDKYKDAALLNMYFFNEETKKLELLYEDNEVKDGFVTLNLEHCSYYFLTEGNVGGFSRLLIVLIALGLLLACGAAFFLIKPKKRRRRKPARRREVEFDEWEDDSYENEYANVEKFEPNAEELPAEGRSKAKRRKATAVTKDTQVRPAHRKRINNQEEEEYEDPEDDDSFEDEYGYEEHSYSNEKENVKDNESEKSEKTSSDEEDGDDFDFNFDDLDDIFGDM